MVNDILNNALFQSSLGLGLRINQTLHQIFHALHFCTLDSLLNYDPDFVVGLRSGLFGERKPGTL